VNDSVPDVIEEAVAGEIDTEMTVGAGATGVTVAQPMANNKQMNSIDPDSTSFHNWGDYALSSSA